MKFASIRLSFAVVKTAEFGDQADQMIYLKHFEKEQLVRCELLFNKKGQLEGFSLAALKENAKDQQTEKK